MGSCEWLILMSTRQPLAHSSKKQSTQKKQQKNHFKSPQTLEEDDDDDDDEIDHLIDPTFKNDELLNASKLEQQTKNKLKAVEVFQRLEQSIRFNFRRDNEHEALQHENEDFHLFEGFRRGSELQTNVASFDQESSQRLQIATTQLAQKRKEEELQRQKELEERKRKAEEEQKMREIQERANRQQSSILVPSAPQLLLHSQQRQPQQQQPQPQLQPQPQPQPQPQSDQPRSQLQHSVRVNSSNERSTNEDPSSRHIPSNSRVDKRGAAKEYERIIQNLMLLQRTNSNVNQQILKRYSETIHTLVNQITSKRIQVNAKVESISKLLDESKSLGGSMYLQCLNVVAAKLIIQSEGVISSAPSSAFAFAMVANRLSQRYPELRDLLIGHFYDKCPYTIPSYSFPRGEGQDDIDYAVKVLKYKRLREGSEEIETEDEYFKRMEGYIYLYSAILTIPDQYGSFPDGMKRAWRWLACLLNSEPRRITPTILIAFLEHAGFFMLQTYGRQFRKILQFIKEDYINRFPPNTNAPKTRILIFIESYESNQLQVPKGFHFD